MTEVLFFFDTEDYTCDESMDAARELAKICTEEGIAGHFAVVGLVAEKLVRDGRRDVIDALLPHVLGTHTHSHSMHPNICEISDVADFEQAYRRVGEMEASGLEMLRAAFGDKRIYFAAPPGNSKSYAAMYWYADKGIPFYCDTVVWNAGCGDVYCCNAMHIAYPEAVESMAFGGTEAIPVLLDEFSAKKRVILYTHPNMAYFSEFWDSRNFRGYNRHSDGAYEMCTRRTPEETAHYLETFRALVRAVRGDERFEITSLPEIESKRKARHFLTRAEIPAEYAQLRTEYAPVRTPSLCLYDIFMAAAAFLGGAETYQPGRAYGLLDAPCELTISVTVSSAAIRAAARRQITPDTFLPPSFDLGGVSVGTGDMLYAMLEVLTTGAETLHLTPHPPMIFLRRYPELNFMALRGTWMHSDAFTDTYLSDRLRLQAYTIREE